MQKQRRARTFTLIVFFLILAVAAGIIYAVRANAQPVAGMPANTGTPDPTEIERLRILSEKTIFPTHTPVVITRSVDLSPELGWYEKYHVVVSRADGTNEDILVGPATHDLIQFALPDQILAKLKLKPGDRVLRWYDIAIKDAHNGQASPTAVITLTPAPPTPTLMNYPPPATAMQTASAYP